MALDDDTIEELATAPKKARTEEGFVEERSVEDLIKADNHLAQKAAITAVPWGVRMARLKPGGPGGV